MRIEECLQLLSPRLAGYRLATNVSALDGDTRRPTHRPNATPVVNSTDSAVGVMGWLHTQSNAGLRIFG